MTPKHELAERLLRVANAITALTDFPPDDLSCAQLSFNQLRALGILEQLPGITQKELAAHLKITPASVSTAIREMETLNMVERRPNPDDARQIQLHLTEFGTSVLTESEQARAAVIARVLDALPLDQQQLIVKGLEYAIRVAQEET